METKTIENNSFENKLSKNLGILIISLAATFMSSTKAEALPQFNPTGLHNPITEVVVTQEIKNSFNQLEPGSGDQLKLGSKVVDGSIDVTGSGYMFRQNDCLVTAKHVVKDYNTGEKLENQFYNKGQPGENLDSKYETIFPKGISRVDVALLVRNNPGARTQCKSIIDELIKTAPKNLNEFWQAGEHNPKLFTVNMRTVRNPDKETPNPFLDQELQYSGQIVPYLNMTDIVGRDSVSDYSIPMLVKLMTTKDNKKISPVREGTSGSGGVNELNSMTFTHNASIKKLLDRGNIDQTLAEVETRISQEPLSEKQKSRLQSLHVIQKAIKSGEFTVAFVTPNTQEILQPLSEQLSNK